MVPMRSLALWAAKERQPAVTPWAFNWYLIQYQALMTLEPFKQLPPLPSPTCPAFSVQYREKKKKVKLKGGWKYLNPFYEDVNETTESTFMLFRLISVRLGSFAFILCKLASTLVGLGGSSKMGLTFSPLTTSATQELIKCWHKEQAGSVSLALQLSFRSVLKKGFTWTPELGRGALAMHPSLAPCPFEHPVTAAAVAGRYHCGQFPPSGTKVPAQLEPKQLLRYRM